MDITSAFRSGYGSVLTELELICWVSLKILMEHYQNLFRYFRSAKSQILVICSFCSFGFRSVNHYFFVSQAKRGRIPHPQKAMPKERRRKIYKYTTIIVVSDYKHVFFRILIVIFFH